MSRCQPGFFSAFGDLGLVAERLLRRYEFHHIVCYDLRRDAEQNYDSRRYEQESYKIKNNQAVIAPFCKNLLSSSCGTPYWTSLCFRLWDMMFGLSK